MRQRRINLAGGNPVTNALMIIAGILVLSVSLALGFVVFIGLFGFMLVAALVLSIRGWWLRRQFMRQGGNDKAAGRERHSPGNDQPTVIEGEYLEVNELDRQPGGGEPGRKDQ